MDKIQKSSTLLFISTVYGEPTKILGPEDYSHVRVTAQNEKRVKILFVADAGNIHTQRWVKYFADKGHEVHLVSQRPFGENNIQNVNLHLLRVIHSQIRVISYLLGLISGVIQIKRFIKKLEPDIIHAHFVTDFGFWAASSGFHPFVLTAWGSDILIVTRKSRIRKLLTKLTQKRADLITCDAEHMKEAIIRLGADPKKIRIVYFGTDIRKFRPMKKSEKIRRELYIFNSPAVISLRSLEPLYDIESLITCIPSVLEEVPKAKFIIAGKGSQEKKLKALAKSLGILDSVRFVGLIPNDKLPRYLTSADVYVSTSLSDAGLSASTAEAMACGLPVIITDFGDNRKWVEDGVNGFVIPLKDPRSLAEKIVYLLKNKDVGMRCGKISREIIKERNDYHKEMKKIESIYKSLVA